MVSWLEFFLSPLFISSLPYPLWHPTMLEGVGVLEKNRAGF